MPAFELTSPDGKKYRVEGPEGATPEQAYEILKKQLAAESGNTRGGDLARGLAHGVASGLGMASGAPEGSSGWRQTGETIGEMAPGVIAGVVAPETKLIQGGVGAVTGALQPAQSLTERGENALIGGGSALVGGQAGKYIAAHRGALNKLANEAIGSIAGFSHLGPWGGLGGLWAGRNVGGLLQNLTGGRGLADLVAAAAKNPGLAAYLGIKASPYAEQAGQFVGQELGKPSE